MTEEEQRMVAHAALAGVRFYRTADSGYGRMWKAVAGGRDVNKFTLPRAANIALRYLGLRSYGEWKKYEDATNDISFAQDVDPEFIDTVLPGWRRDTEECEHATDCNGTSPPNVARA